MVDEEEKEVRRLPPMSWRGTGVYDFAAMVQDRRWISRLS